VIGRRDRLPDVLKHEILQTERATAAGKSLHLRIAIDYSSRDAIARAMGTATAGSRMSSPEQIGHMLSHILTSETGDVDLLIRTGGEKRLSDFLLWESAYAELLFADRMWPDFGAADLEGAVEEFYRRERRFGGIHEITPRSLASPDCAR
jgi:undecaprenyl diphosphate synthase